MENEANFLESIKGRIAPFLTKYPDQEKKLFTLFCRVSKIAREEGSSCAILCLTVTNSFKARFEKLKNLKLDPSIGHELTMALVSLTLATESQLIEIEKYFLEQIGDKKTLEFFLQKELNSTVESDKKKAMDYATALFDLADDDKLMESFQLFVKVTDSDLRQAIQKYYDSIGGTVLFPKDFKSLNYFSFANGEEKGWGHVSVFNEMVMITTYTD